MLKHNIRILWVVHEYFSIKQNWELKVFNIVSLNKKHASSFFDKQTAYIYLGYPLCIRIVRLIEILHDSNGRGNSDLSTQNYVNVPNVCGFRSNFNQSLLIKDV